MTLITRFAPSPTGFLHLGHALSALEVWRWARENNAEVRLRIEDIDHTRCRPEFDTAIREDLAALGLQWQGPVWRQSERRPHYASAIDQLRRKGLIYPCFCNRKDIARNSTEMGHEGPIYAGTCRPLAPDVADARIAAGEPAAWRLKLDEALEVAGTIAWQDNLAGTVAWDALGWGDVVVARKDIGTSYHLSVVVDDAAQAVTHVIRGKDLFQCTHVHIVLQRLLDLPTPEYNHHGLLMEPDGRKLSKSFKSRALRDFADGPDRQSQILQALQDSGVSSSLFDHVGTVTDGADE